MNKDILSLVRWFSNDFHSIKPIPKGQLVQVKAWIQTSVKPLCNTPITQGPWPLCLSCVTTKLARSLLKAERRPNGCLGGSRVVHRMFRHRHGHHGHREVLNMFKTVTQRSQPLSHHGDGFASNLPPFGGFATTAALIIQGRHWGQAAAVTQKQNFLGLGDHWMS